MKSPPGLAKATSRWWREVTARWELDADGLRVLEVGCRAWDAATTAEATVASVGQFYADRHGVIRPHPGLQIALANRKLFLQSLRDLGLEGEVKPPAGGRVNYGPY